MIHSTTQWPKAHLCPLNFTSRTILIAFVWVEKLIVIGLQYENEPMSTIMVFDSMSHTWRNGVEIPVHESGHQIACCALPVVYIAGEIQEAAVYDVFENRWERLPEMKEKIGWVRGYYIDGMFHVVSVYAK